MTFADRVIRFNEQLAYPAKEIQGIHVMNPFKENEEALRVSKLFYKQYYDDNEDRHIILGINPGRFGAGLTGIPFTDPKRLVSVCGIGYNGLSTHEPSSAFIYEMIDAYGGPEKFYKKFYFNSVCPLGFTKTGDSGKEKNYNYYDNKELAIAVRPFIVDNIRKQIVLGIKTDKCFCLGTDKNANFLNKLNSEYKFFGEIIPLAHPRYVMQYKAKQKDAFIRDYCTKLKA